MNTEMNHELKSMNTEVNHEQCSPEHVLVLQPFSGPSPEVRLQKEITLSVAILATPLFFAHERWWIRDQIPVLTTLSALSYRPAEPGKCVTTHGGPQTLSSTFA